MTIEEVNYMLELTPYIPNAEGYIQAEKPAIFIRRDAILTICKDISRKSTQLELTNGNIHHVLESAEQIIQNI